MLYGFRTVKDGLVLWVLVLDEKAKGRQVSTHWSRSGAIQQAKYEYLRDDIQWHDAVSADMLPALKALDQDN